MNDDLCYGHHVWTNRTGYAECTRCGLIDHPAPAKPTVAQLLDFAAAHPGPVVGPTGEAVINQLGVTPTRYLQLLHRAIATQEALEHDPQTTHRLRRLNDQRARTRAARLGHL